MIGKFMCVSYILCSVLIALTACSPLPPAEVPPPSPDVVSPPETAPVQDSAMLEHDADLPLFTTLDIDYTLSDKLPPELVEHIKEQRKSVFTAATDAGKELFKSWLHEGVSREEDARLAEIIRGISFQNGLPEAISKGDAMAEISFLFSYMKAAYSGYGYFGGDTVFLPIKDELLKQLENLALSDGGIDVKEYQKLLAASLFPVIEDAHFHIGDTWFARNRALLYYAVSEELIFHKDSDSFVTELDGVQYTLVSIDGGDSERNVKATLLEDGTFAYVLGEAMSAPRDETPLDILLENADGKRHINVTLRLCEIVGEEADAPAYRQYELDGLMVLENRRLWPDNSPELTRMNFASETNQFQNQQTIIIDVRYNSGGNDSFVHTWLEKFLPVKNVSQGTMMASLASETALIARGYPVSGANTGWSTPYLYAPEHKENQTLTFLLMGRNASSGETWNTILCETDNVIMIGTNSMGCLQYATVARFLLPYSGLNFQCGTSLSIMNQDFSPFELIGYEPDLWIDPALALERVSRFIERYGLNG